MYDPTGSLVIYNVYSSVPEKIEFSGWKMRNILLTSTFGFCLTMILFSCGQIDHEIPLQHGEEIILKVDKGASLVFHSPASATWDSTVVIDGEENQLFELPLGRAVVRVFNCMAGERGVDGRIEILSRKDIQNIDCSNFPCSEGSDSCFILFYYSNDSSIVERMWSRSCGEWTVLQARIFGASPEILFEYVESSFLSSTLFPWRGERNIRLSDRNPRSLYEDRSIRDVSLPPKLNHTLSLFIDPRIDSVSIRDTISVNFREAPEILEYSLYIPPEGVFVDIEGEHKQNADSVYCTPDSVSGFYTGVYTVELSPFYISSGMQDTVVVKGQARPSSAFCAEELYYPGNSSPSHYNVSIMIPDGYSAYSPLDPVGEPVSDGSFLTNRYVSPEGGFMGPMPWVVGRMEDTILAEGHSKFIYPSLGLNAEDLRIALENAGILSELIWDLFGFEGARLDFIIIQPIVGQAILRGSGCLLVSIDQLMLLSNAGSWVDSLCSGVVPKSSQVITKAASAILSRSTYLAWEFRAILSAYTTYLFAVEATENPEETKINLNRALMKFYLYETEHLGGNEYAIADPQLIVSPLAEAVLMAKGPLVIDYLYREMTNFRYGLIRGLQNLRHSGFTYTRLESSMRIAQRSSDKELFEAWFFQPGIPQLRVAWYDSGGGVWIDVKQMQPGPVFPLRFDDCLIVNRDGISVNIDFPGSFTEGRVFLPLGISEGVDFIDIDSENRIPADIVYERLNKNED